MRFSSGLALFAGAASVAAQGAVSPNQKPVGVTGVPFGVNTQTGERPQRLAINTLQSNGGPAWDLYIQAMAALQAMPEQNERSWFQITGIHGLPFADFNGVGNVAGGGTNDGYCPHNMVLFGSWHRPFVALFEQVLVNHAKEIAHKYPASSQQKYINAAHTLRVPYWDWAVDPVLPPAVTATTMTVNGPQGSKTIRNPLYSYQFQKFPFANYGYANFGGSIGEYPQTMRCPTTNDGSAVSQFGNVNSNLNSNAAYLKSSVYATFTQSKEYATMVTDSQGGSNFESPHNNIHNDVGCTSPAPNGHMTNLGWSAFDPIFMLHHAQVDRLVAMWQAINYNDAMFTSTFDTTEAIWGTPDNFAFTQDYVLKPFYKPDKQNMYTSRDVVSTRTFGYTYPELLDWTMSQSQLSATIKSYVNSKYGTSSTKGTITKRDAAPPSKIYQYQAKITLDRSDIILPAQFVLTLNNTVAGTASLLSMPMNGMSTTVIPLQEQLSDVNDVFIKPKDEIVNLLKESLTLTLLGNGTTQSILQVPSLSVQLQVLTVIPPKTDDEFPEFIDSLDVPLILTDLGL